jgi:hypothetical protein
VAVVIEQNESCARRSLINRTDVFRHRPTHPLALFSTRHARSGYLCQEILSFSSRLTKPALWLRSRQKSAIR